LEEMHTLLRLHSDREALIARLEERLTQLNASVEEAQADRDEVAAGVRERTEAQSFLKNRVSASETTVAALTDKARTMEGDIDSKTKALAKVQRELEGALSSIGQKDAEIVSLSAQLNGLNEAVENLERQVAAAKEEQKKLRTNSKAAERTKAQREKAVQ